MKISETLFFSFSLYFYFFSLSNIPTTKAICSNYICGDKEGPPIKFPFRILSYEGKNCGYPGFDLSCSKKGLTILRLPLSQDYLIRYIDYLDQVIDIYDADNCMPKRLLNLNLSGSPFKPVHSIPYTFFNCSSTDFDLSVSRFETIKCLSGSNYKVLATSSSGPFRNFTSKCQLIKKVSVPISLRYFEYGFDFNLEGDIQLIWSAPDCGDCASNGGTCGFKNGTSGEIGCSNNPERVTVLPRSSARLIISLGIGIPVIVSVIGLACYICIKPKASNGDRGEFFSSHTPEHAVVTVGLDKSTIESYPKTILNRSLRLQNPDDNCCSICLSEYQAKEELRTIPECKHSFHSRCIDGWLLVNATCPLCRVSPSSIPHVVTVT